MTICFQNIGQLMNRYPDNEWQEILGNCDIHVALGCTDEVTATHLSARTGEVTVGVSSTGRQLSSWQVSNYTPQYRETSSVGKRKLLTMDEVLRMPLDEELVIIRGQKVLKLSKYDYEEHFHANQLIPMRATDYVPQWVAEEYWYERQRKYNDPPIGKKAAASQTTQAAAPEPAVTPTDEDKPRGRREKPASGNRRAYRKLTDESSQQETLY